MKTPIASTVVPTNSNSGSYATLLGGTSDFELIHRLYLFNVGNPADYPEGMFQVRLDGKLIGRQVGDSSGGLSYFRDDTYQIEGFKPEKTDLRMVLISRLPNQQIVRFQSELSMPILVWDQSIPATYDAWGNLNQELKPTSLKVLIDSSHDSLHGISRTINTQTGLESKFTVDFEQYIQCLKQNL
jgi:hypothetical protein